MSKDYNHLLVEAAVMLIERATSTPKLQDIHTRLNVFVSKNKFTKGDCETIDQCIKEMQQQGIIFTFY